MSILLCKTYTQYTNVAIDSEKCWEKIKGKGYFHQNENTPFIFIFLSPIFSLKL